LGSAPQPSSGCGCGTGRHPPLGSAPHPASGDDSLQTVESKDQNVSSKEGWLTREPMRARAMTVLRIGAFS